MTLKEAAYTRSFAIPLLFLAGRIVGVCRLSSVRWCLGRLQTDADRARVVEGLAGTGSELGRVLNATLQRLAPRWFLVRDVHAAQGLTLLQPRWSLSWMRGPMTRSELRTALGG